MCISFLFPEQNLRPTRELRRRSKIRNALKDDFVSSWESDEDEKDQELNAALIASLGHHELSLKNKQKIVEHMN